MSRRWSSELTKSAAQNKLKVELRVSTRWSSESAENRAQIKQKVDLE